MTLGDMETAALAFVERVQKVGTGPALAEVEEAVRAQTYEEIARRFEAAAEPYVARMVREMRHR